MESLRVDPKLFKELMNLIKSQWFACTDRLVAGSRYGCRPGRSDLGGDQSFSTAQAALRGKGQASDLNSFDWLPTSPGHV